MGIPGGQVRQGLIAERSLVGNMGQPGNDQPATGGTIDNRIAGLQFFGVEGTSVHGWLVDC